MSTRDTVYVLNAGYVRLRDHMGSDLSVVDAARVSFDKQGLWFGRFPWLRSILFRMISWLLPPFVRHWIWRLRPRDKRLLRFLAKHLHKLPFAHCQLTFEIYAPVIVARQWFKHRVGSAFTEEPEIAGMVDAGESSGDAWNESSRRYITENNEYYIPSVWRAMPENRKQGSAGPVDPALNHDYQRELSGVIAQCDAMYQKAIDDGIAPEQARLFLPYGALYIRFMWTCSLLRVIEFLKLRDADDAQFEIAEYARAVRALTEQYYPESFAAWFEDEEEDRGSH